MNKQIQKSSPLFLTATNLGQLDITGKAQMGNQLYVLYVDFLPSFWASSSLRRSIYGPHIGIFCAANGKSVSLPPNLIRTDININ